MIWYAGPGDEVSLANGNRIRSHPRVETAMAGGDQITKALQPLRGELPAGGEERLTYFLCCHRDDLKDGIFPRLMTLDSQQKEASIHLHVLDLNELDQAQLILFASTLTPLDVSVTWESIGPPFEKDAASLVPEFGLLRLFECLNRVPGCYVSCTVETVLFSLQVDLKIDLEKNELVVGDDPLACFAITPTQNAQTFIGAVAKALLERLQQGTLKSGDGARAFSSIRDAMAESKSLRVGDISPLHLNADRPREEPLENRRTDSMGAVFDRLWRPVQSSSNGRRVLILEPDMTLPFKTPPLVSHLSGRVETSPLLHGSMGELRRSWLECFRLIEEKLKERGHHPVTICVPGSEITPALANASDADVVIMPHRQKFQCPGLNVSAVYLMQVAHPMAIHPGQKRMGCWRGSVSL